MRFSLFLSPLASSLLLAVIGLFSVGPSVPVSAEVPLLGSGSEDPSVTVVHSWREEVAEAALQAGLAGVAEAIYDGLIATSAVDGAVLHPAKLAQLRKGLASALIGQRRFQAAGRALAEVPEPLRGSTWYLYHAITLYGEGRTVNRSAFFSALDAIETAELGAENRAWYFLLNGLRSDFEGNQAAATLAFEAALEAAVGESQKYFLESLILRQKILQSPSDEVLAAELRSKLERLKGKAAALPFAREYAIVLNNLGRTEEALAVIDQEQESSAVDYAAGERDQLLLLKGLILGADSAEGRLVFRQLVRNGRDRETMGIALQLLARNAGDGLSFFEFLNQIITRAEPHPLLGQMHYLRSQLALASGQTEAIAIAEADARVLLERFPGFEEINSVYRLLAYAALLRNPPQYRAAADFLVQLRDRMESGAERRNLNRLIGDCYFLNGDFATAVDFFQAARSDSIPVDQADALLLRLVTAQVRAGAISAALESISAVDFAGKVSLESRWQAEWNIAQALQGQGDSKVALERVRGLLEQGEAGSVPPALDLRFRWLEARLSLIDGQTEGVGPRVERLLERIEALPADTLPPELVALLKTEIILLQSDILIQTGSAEAGLKVLRELRANFPDSSAAERSYLVEVGYHNERGSFQSAQEVLQTLAATFPKSPLAPQALFEAALYSERRGTEFYADAIRIHNDLAERYAESPLVYPARLKQGDMLRQMNDFVGAQIIYENLINRFPEHPRRYIAELSRADCMLALAKENGAQLGEVISVLGRLLDIPNLPADFRLEIGYKLGFALVHRNALTEATQVFSLQIGRFLADKESVKNLSAVGAYWMSRTLLDLGSLHENSAQPGKAVEIYRLLIDHNLPGRGLAQSRIRNLPPTN